MCYFILYIIIIMRLIRTVRNATSSVVRINTNIVWVYIKSIDGDFP